MGDLWAMTRDGIVVATQWQWAYAAKNWRWLGRLEVYAVISSLAEARICLASTEYWAFVGTLAEDKRLPSW
jgi:hypothetical protein